MDFIPQPEEAKKFGSIKWLKWHIYKYPTIFILIVPCPFLIYRVIRTLITHDRQLKEGTYVPHVVLNRYAICRPTDWSAQNTPKRYQN